MTPGKIYERLNLKINSQDLNLFIKSGRKGVIDKSYLQYAPRVQKNNILVNIW